MEEVNRSSRPARQWWKWGLFIAAGLLLLGWLMSTPPGWLGKADAIGYAVCHRISARSFHIGDRPLPLCARCSGQYLGAVLGLTFQYFAGRRRTGTPPRRVIAILLLFVLVYAVDGLNSYLHLQPLMRWFPDLPRLYEPNNTLRLLTGTGMGIAVSAALFPAFNSAIFRQRVDRPALSGLGSLAALAGMGLALDGLILTESAWVLYPLALVSAAGVLVLLSMVYSMVWVMATRHENRYERLIHMAAPLTAGFITGLAQIAFLDAFRYLLTGSWSGFLLG